MDKREMLDRLAANGDERLLLGRVWDKYEQCRRRNLPEGTGFLSPAEQAAAQRLLNALSVTEGYAFWGGYDGAQRRQLWFLPEWQEAPEEDAVRVVRASFYEEDALTHRDLLGSLMALGNHSPRFHALLDRLVGGKEKLLNKELRSYRAY